jgi:membrane protease YdiL (CAAX protease family)
MLSQILGDRSLVNRLRLVGVIVLLGPIGEELVLRGWLQSQLERRWSPLVAVLVTALVFGVMHGVDVRLGYFVTLGAMFGTAAIAFRSLWAAIILHMSVNAMGAIPLLLGTGTTPPAELAAKAPSPWWGVAGVAIVLVAYPQWIRRVAAETRL